MKQFKNILVIAPFEKHLLRQATSLMSSSQSKLTLMSVVPELEDSTVTTQDGRQVDLQELLIQETADHVQQTSDELKAMDFRVRSRVVSGDHAFLRIVEQVIDQQHDLVMMLADGISSVREQLFGTLSMHLMRKCPCAVWVVKPTRRRKFRNIFAAVDPDPENPIRDGLNKKILKRASAIAHNSGAKLHVIHAWNSSGNSVTQSRAWMNRQEVRLHAEKVAISHRNRLSQLLKDQLDGSEVVHMIQGAPGATIPEKISDLNADMLVMGTVCRTGIPGFFIGNTAESILHQVDCSVLTVKPDEFESPIQSPG